MESNGQVTREEAIALEESKFYLALTDREIAEFQMVQRRLCMPFSVFHKAVGKTLGRPVFNHELATNYDGIMAELRGEGNPPTMEEIINMIPANKRSIIVVRKDNDE